MTPVRRLCQQQRRRVRAGHEQQQRDAAGDDEERRLDGANGLFGERNQARTHCTVRVGMIDRHARGKRLELRRCARDRGAVRQARDDWPDVCRRVRAGTSSDAAHGRP